MLTEENVFYLASGATYEAGIIALCINVHFTSYTEGCEHWRLWFDKFSANMGSVLRP